jgi:hypothetical protein
MPSSSRRTIRLALQWILSLPGDLDVVGLVEASLQLDQDRDLLVVPGGPLQGRHHR